MKYLSWIVGGFATLLMAVTSNAHAEEPFATGSFKQACVIAKQTKRIVLIDFYTTWCGPCKMLDQKTWADKEVRTWLVAHTVSRKIDAEKEKELAGKYKIDAYPTILLLKPDGTEIDRLVGYREPKTFLTEAHQALSGQDSIARAKAKLSGAAKDDPMERMDYAHALAEKGHDAEALKEYLWCLDEGNKHNQGFYGVRLSFLLADIIQLGAKYPPALDALKQRRDSARTALEKGSADPNLIADFTAYNENLGQQDQTLAVYTALKTDTPEVAKALFDNVFSLLLQQKRYADIVADAGDIAQRVDQQIAQYNQVATDSRLNKEIRTYMKGNTLDTCVGYYEALEGTDKSTEADALRNKLLAFDGSAATYTSLVQHAARAEKPEAVQKLVALAKSALSPEDFKLVEKAAAK